MESVTVLYNDGCSLRLSPVDWTGYKTDPLKGHSPFKFICIASLSSKM